MIKAPSFWFEKNSWRAKLLWPVSFLYQLGHRVRWGITTSKSSPLPLICVGNTGVGGAGKTPTALALGSLLESMGHPYRFLTRGYGGKEKGPLIVNGFYHKAEQVGDEPLLLAKAQTTIMAKDRVQGLALIKKESAHAIIMDDGYQNPTLKKTLNILVIDGKQGFGNGCVFPAGPLRETLSMSLARASGVVVIGKASREVTKALKGLECPIFKATLMLKPPPELEKKVFPFAGIAFPDKFFNALKQEKYKLAETRSFPDHYPYEDLEFQGLRRQSRALGATLVTTEKDYMRLSSAQRKFVTPIPVALEWEDEKALEAFLKTHLFA